MNLIKDSPNKTCVQFLRACSYARLAYMDRLTVKLSPSLAPGLVSARGCVLPVAEAIVLPWLSLQTYGVMGSALGVADPMLIYGNRDSKFHLQL